MTENKHLVPIQKRLVMTILSLLVMGMTLAVIMSWIVVQRNYLETQRENLLAQAIIIASTLTEDDLPDGPADIYSQTSNVTPGLHTRLLGEQGAVLLKFPISEQEGIQPVPPAEDAGFVSSEELRLRPEIQSALSGYPDSYIRRVESAENRRVLYAAAPVFSEDGKASGVVYLATPLPPAGLPQKSIIQVAIAILSALTISALIGLVLARRITRPLINLSRAAGQVANGHLNVSLKIDEDISELHNLGLAFNQMTASLQRSEIVRNAFIADVTHELRTPLTVIHGTIETLEDGTIDDHENRGPLIASMANETRRLIRLVNNLLILTRADAGALNLNLETIDLFDLVKQRCDYFSTVYSDMTCKIHKEENVSPFVLADHDRLTQIVDNLLNNALKAITGEANISILIGEPPDHQGRIFCSIQDNGPGIPPEKLPYIFERFYRIEASRNRHRGGSGLGLSIVRSLLTALHGGIEARSKPGKGAMFTFWLPSINQNDEKLTQN